MNIRITLNAWNWQQLYLDGEPLFLNGKPVTDMGVLVDNFSVLAPDYELDDIKDCVDTNWALVVAEVKTLYTFDNSVEDYDINSHIHEVDIFIADCDEIGYVISHFEEYGYDSDSFDVDDLDEIDSCYCDDWDE